MRVPGPPAFNSFARPLMQARLPDRRLRGVGVGMGVACRAGRIGPLPYYRSGGHTEQGFLWISGPGIEAGTQLADGRPTSLAPTFLALLGARVPHYMNQLPLLRASTLRRPIQ